MPAIAAVCRPPAPGHLDWIFLYLDNPQQLVEALALRRYATDPSAPHVRDE
jgi:hypothetical protein